MLAVTLHIYPVDIKIEVENWRVALFLKWRISLPTVLWSPYVTKLNFRWFFKYLFQMQGRRWTLAAVLKLKCVGILLSQWTKCSWTPVFHWTGRVPFPVWLRNETQCTQGAWLITCIALVQRVCSLGIFIQRFFTLICEVLHTKAAWSHLASTNHLQVLNALFLSICMGEEAFNFLHFCWYFKYWSYFGWLCAISICVTCCSVFTFTGPVLAFLTLKILLCRLVNTRSLSSLMLCNYKLLFCTLKQGLSIALIFV